jgi:hypothetical protein
MSAPQWSPVDDDTADLLTLVADEGHVSADFEWDLFIDAVHAVSTWRADRVIQPNDLRPLVRDRVAPRRIGAFTNRAVKSGLIVPTGDWQVSDDTEGRNAGRPMRVYRWTGGAL